MDECTTHFTTLARNHQVVPWPSSNRPPLMLWKRWCLRFRILSGPCPCLNSVSKWNGPTRSWPRIVRDSNRIYSMTCPQSMRIPHGFVLNGGCCRHPPCGKTSELVFAWCRSYWWNNQEVVFTRTGSHGSGFLVRTVATLLLLLTELALLVDPY